MLAESYEHIRLSTQITISELTYTNDYDYEDEIDKPDIIMPVTEIKNEVKGTAAAHMCLVNHCLNGGTVKTTKKTI